MAAWVDLATLHNPATGTSPPASWGDGINGNFDIATFRNAKAAEVATSQTTASTSYADLSTVGPAVTVDTATTAIVLMHAQFGLSGAGGILISYAVSGATTIAAADDRALYIADALNNQGAHMAMALATGLTPGLNTFTLKYKVSANTGTFLRRRIAVLPLF